MAIDWRELFHHRGRKDGGGLTREVIHVAHDLPVFKRQLGTPASEFGCGQPSCGREVPQPPPELVSSVSLGQLQGVHYLFAGAWDGQVRVWEVRKVCPPPPVPAWGAGLCRPALSRTPRRCVGSARTGQRKGWRTSCLTSPPKVGISGCIGRSASAQQRPVQEIVTQARCTGGNWCVMNGKRPNDA